ncbi:MAG: hypothetical protein ABJG33_00100 [Balneola sp.]
MYIPNFNFSGLPNGILFEAANDSGSAATEVTLPPEVLESFKSLLKKEGSDTDAAMKLFSENYEYRKEIRDLKSKIEGTKSLSDEEHAEYTALKAILTESGHEKVEDFKASIAEDKTSKAELEQLKQEKANNEVAEVAGFNPKVLNQLAKGKDLEVKTRTNDKGEAEKYAVIKDGDTEKNLTDYAKSEWEDFLPSLQVSESNNEGQQGRRIASQSAAASQDGAEVDPVKARLEKNRKERGISDE